mgnify:FL=1
MNKLGFIGMGNMAQALATGFIKSGKIKPSDIFAYAPHLEKLKENAKKIGFTPVDSLDALVDSSDTTLIACKPYQIEDVISQIKHKLVGKAVISIALGWDFAKYYRILGNEVRIQFVMPNTPAMTGEGVMLFEQNNSLGKDERMQIMGLFTSVGIVEELPTNLMGIGGAITGCGPAFVDLMIEAYADAAVKYGIPRKDSYRLVSQMILGSAKLCLEAGEHPAVLKDNVCSPGGSTICGVTTLEEKGFRNACISSIDAIMNKKTN